ncbi:hypothetical protein [Marinicrinis lubricantis]|uniref:Uncharacterized protein n=1 Tax=Marinicrinis lubricantis TaxID=2086470 RepID=A0ABW1IKQ0_9BACL
MKRSQYGYIGALVLYGAYIFGYVFGWTLNGKLGIQIFGLPSLYQWLPLLSAMMAGVSSYFRWKDVAAQCFQRRVTAVILMCSVVYIVLFLIFFASADEAWLLSMLMFVIGTCAVIDLMQECARRLGMNPFWTGVGAVLVLCGTLGLHIPGQAVSAPYFQHKIALSEANRHTKGTIAVPEMITRNALVADGLAAWIGNSTQLTVEAPKDDRRTEEVEQIKNILASITSENPSSEIGYTVNEQFYRQIPNQNTPDGLMEALALFNELTGKDMTQGQKVMGIGTILEDGRIEAVPGIYQYTAAALRADPDVFFVPLESLAEAVIAAPDMLIVPVTTFEEVLYFLNQPVTFWPIVNFGLYCH